MRSRIYTLPLPISGFVAAMLVVSCSTESPPHGAALPLAPKKTAAEPLPNPVPAEPPVDASFSAQEPACPKDDNALDSLAHSEVKDARVLSPRSLSLKLHLDTGDKAVWKPLLLSNDRALNEVAAFRVSRLLGVCEVPVAVQRSLSLEEIVSIVAKRDAEVAGDLKLRAAKDERGTTSGAMIAWVGDIDETALRQRGGLPFLKRLVDKATIGELNGDDLALAFQYSRMIVFDYVIGNWDRFSGGNLFQSRDGKRLVLIDHNNAFAPWSLRQRDRMNGQLEALTKFDKAQIASLRALDAERLRRSLDERAPLGQDAFDLVLERAGQVLRRVERLEVQRRDPYLPQADSRQSSF